MNRTDLDKSDRLKISIGEVVIRFQSIENDLSEILCILLKMKEKNDPQRICAAMSFRQKVELVCELHSTRKDKNLPDIDTKIVKKALNAAEEFRNSIVHSFWYVSGSNKIVWMRSKPNLRTKSGLNYVNGVANINGIENGIESLNIIRDCWYLGKNEELNAAANKVSAITKRLSR